MSQALRRCAALLGLCATSLVLALPAQAATVRVKCEVRADRSVASVDGAGLAAGAAYTAVLSSGSQSATSAAQAAKATGEAEFDFSSRRRDIAAGATAIAADFIVGNQVTGRLVDAQGNTVASASRSCRVR